MQVLLPQTTSSAQVGLQSAPQRRLYPVLYLLHGWSDDETIWMRRTSIERYAAEKGLIVVMPRVDQSYYQDMHSGMAYWSFISEELPALCQAWFPLSPKRSQTFAAGLSMGGYGALRLGLSYPERFGAVASLSGVVDLAYPLRRESGRRAKIDAIFGPETEKPSAQADLFVLAEQAILKNPAPRIFQCCGTEDFLYADNVRFRRHVESLGLDLTYEEGPGEHEWGYSDRMIQRVISWLPENACED